ncbi:MAG: 5-methyltetrahydropteroyltriglutamate--homocysteine S-methyltransferase [Deltaproteobacteria bacterium]|nr:5-methyltetrahydropteroyltriglutamate--homocysteine S-methyltransferase [Deltaproteobacteria bacterium]
MKSHVLGFPRIGAERELKQALEDYWNGAIDDGALIAVGDRLRERHWRFQAQAGLSLVATGDFSFYDQVLDTAVMLGAIPPRFRELNPGPPSEFSLKNYFRMARGDAARNLAPLEMTKWFDTNYHYLVPEFTPDLEFHPGPAPIVAATQAAKELGYCPKPVLLGPVTFLALGKELGAADRWSRLDEILPLYAKVIAQLAPCCEWLQIDEPILATDLSQPARDAFPSALKALKKAAGATRVLLATYFGELGDNLGLALGSGCDALHLDLVRAPGQLEQVLERLPPEMALSAGIVDGRNIWRNDLGRSAEILRNIAARIGSERLLVASSCSLLHTPVDLDLETDLDPVLKSWMAFAVQKCRETAVLHELLTGCDRGPILAEQAAALASRRDHPRVCREKVRSRCAAVSPKDLERHSPFAVRKECQRWLKLPLLPTTTIGSFPQTAEIRSMRLQYRRGTVDRNRYEEFMRRQIADAIRCQEELGLDVLVHGEPERNDMVEYFGQQLDGFCFTRNGWVQSYGSRCVKPPIIYGDVSRPAPLTVPWIRYAQSLTPKPVKGMLTGPVTILCWSFVRDDLPRSEVCKQLALAVRDEVLELEEAGIRIIQIDEAALREGLPLRRKDYDTYLRWAVDCFRLAVSGVEDATQIHTHMCYSEFNTIVPWIAAMDADVISIESSRSRMELLEAFHAFEYPNDIGPGVYDIHSPRVPTVEEMAGLLQKALDVVPAERLWVNPDCGLKTRGWPESLASLRNMVAAAARLRHSLQPAPPGTPQPQETDHRP